MLERNDPRLNIINSNCLPSNLRKTFIHQNIDVGNLKAKTTLEGRVYTTPDGKKYPSITTVLGKLGKKEIFEWRNRVGAEEANRVARHASTRGTALHSICDRYISGEEEIFKVNTMPHVRKMFMSILPVINTRIDNVFLHEKALFSDLLGLAGRVDLIADFDKIPSVIDVKSSSRVKTKEDIHSYFIQETAYAIMFEERTGIRIRQIVTLMGVENSSTPLVFIEKTNHWVSRLKDMINAYHETFKT